MPADMLDADIDAALDQLDRGDPLFAENENLRRQLAENDDLRQQLAGKDATIDQLGKTIAELQTKITDLQGHGTQQAAADADWRNRELASFVAQHPEYRSDPELIQDALAANEAIVKRHPEMGFREQLEAVHKRMLKLHPEKFPIRNVPRHTTVSAPTRGGGGWGAAKKKRTVADLPEGARTAMEMFVRRGVLTPEQYLKDYQWEEDELPSRLRGRR
jgi:hypothetical protein